MVLSLANDPLGYQCRTFGFRLRDAMRPDGCIDRWVGRLVARGKSEGRMPVGLEVRDGLGWVFSIRPLEGARMQDFLDCALDLRGAVLQEVQRRPATISVPVNTVTGEADRRARESTAPMFAPYTWMEIAVAVSLRLRTACMSPRRGDTKSISPRGGCA